MSVKRARDAGSKGIRTGGLVESDITKKWGGLPDLGRIGIRGEYGGAFRIGERGGGRTTVRCGEHDDDDAKKDDHDDGEDHDDARGGDVSHDHHDDVK